jgi:hypothetical protein
MGYDRYGNRVLTKRELENRKPPMVTEQVLEKRFVNRAATPFNPCSEVLSLHAKGWLPRQIAMMLGRDLSDVNRSIRHASQGNSSRR